MTEKQLERADKLFEKLNKLAPCKTCLNDTCEECRWVICAKGNYTRTWDHYNYFDGGHENKPQDKGEPQ